MRTGLMFVVTLLLGGPAYAQCVTACPSDAPRDAKGCCIVEAKAKAKAKAKSGDTIEACPAGKERSQFTAGHCCWPEQEWSSKDQKCTGTPTCAMGFVAKDDDCQCPEGQAVTDFTSGHCCWPNQEWSTKSNQCSGPAKCPKDFESGPGGCQKIIRGTLTLIVTGGKLCLFTLNGRRLRPYPFNSIREQVAVGSYTVGCVRDEHDTITHDVTVTAEGKSVLFRAR
jgi:hypothetical protein